MTSVFLLAAALTLGSAAHHNPVLVISEVSWLPRPDLTPGAIDPRVTQANIQRTICRSGYTAKVRPSSSYTSKLKRQQLEQYGYSGSHPYQEEDPQPSAFEEDHLISLEIGGHPTDPRNLWPEPWKYSVADGGAGSKTVELGAHAKDRVENWLHKQVCTGQMSLDEAQRGIAHDWTQYLDRSKQH